MKYSTYVIENSNGVIYIGHTNNVPVRIKRHNKKLSVKSKSFTAKQGGVWELIYKEEFKTREEAIEREKQLKSSRGRDFLKQFRKHKK